MQIFLHIGLPHCGTTRLQQVFDEKRGQLASKGVLYPSSPGRKNHTRLYMSVTDPDHVDPLRWNRGFGSPQTQQILAEQFATDLNDEINAAKPDKLILSAEQLSASLCNPSELSRLRTLLAPFSDDIRIIAHVDEQARVLTRHYGEQIMSGRITNLQAELQIAETGTWRARSLKDWSEIDPMINAMPEVQSVPFWLDYQGLTTAWEEEFGTGNVSLRGYDETLFASPDVIGEICEAFELPRSIGKTDAGKVAVQPSAQWLTRSRQMNEVFQTALQTGRIIPRQMWRRMLGQFAVPGAPIAPGSLHKISDAFAKTNKALVKDHVGLKGSNLKPDAKLSNWTEAPVGGGFRATQYMTVFLPLIDKTTKEERQRKKNVIAALDQTNAADEANGSFENISPEAAKILPPMARANFAKLQGGRFEPHNNIGRVNEEELAAPYDAIEKRKLPKGNSGNVIVACMKNEGPYIVEWVAYHLAMGVDNILIYTNGCDDGTSEILDRLQELGAVQHRNNDNWKGNSPQQHALNKSLKEDVVKNAEWIAHIDVDEFINVRTGNGTLQDFLARVPDATNVAMTWRLFGHNNIAKFEDKPVIGQFDACAPKYCPKPHTVWGFKTMFRNNGAYEKISCHRPNKLKEGRRDQVKWVNGSGMPMGDEVKDKGWRSGVKSIGYDLIQLNHYALRSAESFLIKRQRGRALHVDRTIGLNYWVRMDWSDNKDITIQRNLPRLQAEMNALFQDKKLAKLHAASVVWHRAKADDLHTQPEFQELYAQALDTHLSELERVAYSLALDMES